MSGLDEMRDLMSYNRWAHDRVLGAVATLGQEPYNRVVGGSFPSLRATMEHLLGAELSWLARWLGTPAGVVPDFSGCDTVETLRERWNDLWARQETFLTSLGENDLYRMIDIRLRSGAEARLRIGDMIRHVVNHSTYHRGQVTNFVRQLGGTPVATDYIAYCMQRDDAARASGG